MTKSKALFALVLLFGAGSPFGAPRGLDQEQVHDLYNEGDFDGVSRLISLFRQENREYSKEDSVFIAKHLAVVYAANPKSVGQGKYWMNELLKLLPAADLVGMYVSDEIDRIFESVRKEFLARQNAFGVDTARVALPERPKIPTGDSAAAAPPRNPADGPATAPVDGGRGIGAAATRDPPSGPGRNEEKRRALKRSYWLLGGSAAAAAAGITAYLLLSSSGGNAPEKEISVPRNPKAQ